MKQINKYSFGSADTSVMTASQRLQPTLEELQLEINYIDYGEHLINIHCGIPEELDDSPEVSNSLYDLDGETDIQPDAIFFSKKISIKLSKEDIQKLILSVDALHGSNEFKTTISSGISISNSMENDFLDKIFNLIEDNMSNDNYWVDNLSYDMNVSRSTLFRKLKNLTGQAPQAFMKKIRLERALHLLEMGQLRIAEVAYQVGFSDPNYFSKCFRKLFGKSPSSFMARSKNLYLP